MTKTIKYSITFLAVTLFFSCSGGKSNSSDVNVDTDTISPGPVNEMDKSRYNLNEPDEMLHEMQDSTGIGAVTNDSTGNHH